MTGAAADPSERDWRRYIRKVQGACDADNRLEVMAGVVRALARVTGWRMPGDLRLASVDIGQGTLAQRVAGLDPPEGLADAWLPGRVHEALLGVTERRAAGAHYTPRTIASGLVAWAAADRETWPGATTICDPACGGGAFLLAAADHLLAGGADPVDIVRHTLWGVDVDPIAVSVTDAALSHWAWSAGGQSQVTAGLHLVTGDALLKGASVWSSLERVPGFDLVVGNPPFQGQLGASTARRPRETAALRAHLGDSVTGYVDSAALFVLAACRLARPGGRVALLQPISVFAARDTARIRSEVLRRARLVGVWTAGSRVFRANVRVGAVVLDVDDRAAAAADAGSGPGSVNVVRRASGPDFVPLPEVATSRAELQAAGSWSHLIAGGGTPQVAGATTAGCMRDLASATAGFRDEYYGLIPFVSEATEPAADPVAVAGGPAPLVTSGLIDPLHCRWGTAASRFAGHEWLRPVVDVAAVREADARLGQWLDHVLVPKVLVACQTRVVEAIVDEAGAFVPSVPVIAVRAEHDRLFDVAAALLAPFTSAWAVMHVAGSALGADAIKLSARQVLEVPLPADGAAWAEGASLLRSAAGRLADPRAFAATMNRAYGLGDDDDLARWWLARLPART